MKDRTKYQQKYYKTKTMAKLRQRIKALEIALKEIVESPEGIAYRNRKTKEYQKEYREKNKHKGAKYREEYKKYG